MSTAKLYTICRLSADWHSGQWSRVYRIGCRAHKLLQRRGISRPLDQIRLVRPEFRRDVARHMRDLRDAFKRG